MLSLAQFCPKPSQIFASFSNVSDYLSQDSPGEFTKTRATLLQMTQFQNDIIWHIQRLLLSKFHNFGNQYQRGDIFPN